MAANLFYPALSSSDYIRCSRGSENICTTSNRFGMGSCCMYLKISSMPYGAEFTEAERTYQLELKANNYPSEEGQFGYFCYKRQ